MQNKKKVFIDFHYLPLWRMGLLYFFGVVHGLGLDASRRELLGL